MILTLTCCHDSEWPPTGFRHRSSFVKKLLIKKVWKITSYFLSIICNIKNYSISFLAYVMTFHAKWLSSHLPSPLLQGCLLREMTFTSSAFLFGGWRTHDFHAKRLPTWSPTLLPPVWGQFILKRTFVLYSRTFFVTQQLFNEKQAIKTCWRSFSIMILTTYIKIEDIEECSSNVNFYQKKLWSHIMISHYQIK